MRILPVSSTRELDAFIRFPWGLYAGDKNWVPPLVSSERKMLDPKRNPFYDHAEACHFLAERDGAVVGRISAILNRTHNERLGEKTGFWGYFECENDPAAAGALFDTVAAWHRERGMTRLLGPANPSLNDPCGLLVDGFQWSPFVLMTYNPEYYVPLIEGAGFTKATDLLAYILLTSEVAREKIDRVAKVVQKRGQVRLRMMDLSRIDSELAIVKDIYNDAWDRNWGFIPMTEAEIHFSAEDMKAILLPELAYVAEVNGEPVAFALALPDINLALKKCNGSLWPFGWFHFLRWNLRKIPTLRLVALGVKRAYQHLGIGTLFYQKYIQEGLRLGYRAAELSWVLETNDLMNRPIREMGGKPYKTYRLYERSLSQAHGS
jgi:GNAT superfamily N-acetyltransferase